ncbi:HAAS domain-containing protein [Alkalihalobacillus sp. CinArs1]|uniref:HAAS domain-containing protein n=1 Tax=Alkalihalobacillus sp. CinArs1 TaxID=2995314 RepID=UPI0022DDC426|nr:DUF1129 family protein [Alkalihalobacillus sp. CinArs1]
MGLSVQSQEFLANLRLYLISSGKNEDEIESIISELNDHLLQAEKAGKDVSDIIGKSPKDYMKQLSKEMPIDRKDVLKYSLMVMIGAIAFIVLGNVVRGGIEASVLELISYPLIILFYIGLISVTFRRIATSGNKMLVWTLLGIVGAVPTVLILALLFLNGAVETPTVTFHSTWNIIAAAVAVLLIIGLSLWTRTWVMIIIAAIVFVPDLIMNVTELEESTKIITSSMLIMLGMAIYLFFMWKKDKKQNVIG